MTSHENEDFLTAGLAVRRFNDLLELLSTQGFTQAQIAAKAGLPPQYLSDIKRSRRPMTELVARRLGEAFEVNFQWLLGTSASMNPPPSQSAAQPASGASWLPLFSHPIEGEPRAHPQWDGTGIEIAGAAAAKLLLAKRPYLLRFGRNDVRGRLRSGDLILISQVESEEAEIQVVRYRKKCFLARANDDGSWTRVATGKPLDADCPVTGHCVGIVWSSLL